MQGGLRVRSGCTGNAEEGTAQGGHRCARPRSMRPRFPGIDVPVLIGRGPVGNRDVALVYVATGCRA